MNGTFLEAVAHRRSYYALKNESPVTDAEIQTIIETALLHVPSAFNSQSTRILLLLGGQHRRVWEITKEVLRGIVPAAAFGRTENKIDTSFLSGYGTLLFYEDQTAVKAMQDNFPTYAANFPVWSEHTNAMHQLVIWTALEEVGFGASLQHYNPLIDGCLVEEFDIPASWKLIAQMPFGMPAAVAGEKTFLPLEERLRVMR